MADHILVTQADRILEIRFNRPEKRNAITAAMYDALSDALDAAAADQDVRVALIVGSGGHFTAGNDLADFRDAAALDGGGSIMRFLRTIAAFPKALVAAVEGSAVGIGTTMLLHCDLAVAGRGARFAMPFVNLAFVPEAGSSLILPALLGHQRAAKLLMLGEPFDAPAALEYGIVADVVDDANVEAAARDWALRLAAKAPLALMETKRLMRGDPETISRRLEEEAAAFSERLRSPEAAEAIAAFYEKRPPRFG